MAAAALDDLHLDDEELTHQFKPSLLPPGPSSLGYVAISLDKLDIGDPVQPNTKLYKSVWNHSNGTQEPVAVKLVGKLNEREVDVLSGIQHKNIVRFFGAVFEPPTNYGLVLELCVKGSLFDYIHAASNQLELDLALKLSKGIIAGVRYLHLDAPDAPIKHNNLTSHEVVLQDVKGELVPKIAGFGYARQHSDSQMTTSRGKVHIHALLSPERIRGERSSPESDIYSVGIIMSELLSRKVPFEGYPLFKACRLVTEQGQRPELPPTCPMKLAHLIKCCWEDDPDNRPTAGEVESKLTRFIRKPGTLKEKIIKPEPSFDDDIEPVPHRQQSQPRSASPTGSAFSWTSTTSWAIDNFDDSEVGVDLGSGRIGVVKKATYRGSPVAVKGVHQFLKNGFEKYMETVYPIEHENIVKILGATRSYIVMEEMPMSLKARLNDGPITDNSVLLKIAIGVASGLHYLHTLPNQMVHGSIHSRNVFLDYSNNAKISDFGYIVLDREVGLAPTGGMEKYHAPEGRHITRYSIGVDIYSFGILLVEMRTLDFDVKAICWQQLHKLTEKYTKKRQEGMYDRGKISMQTIIKELKQLRK